MAMPDLPTHALIADTCASLLSVRYRWLDPQYMAVTMAGAFVPDLVKLKLLASSGRVEAVLGVPFDWFVLRTAGGVAVALLVGVMLAVRRERHRVAGLLAVGTATHLATDALLRTPSDRSFDVFWPVTRYNPPTPGLYLSTQPEPTVVAALATLAACALTKSLPERNWAEEAGAE